MTPIICHSLQPDIPQIVMSFSIGFVFFLACMAVVATLLDLYVYGVRNRTMYLRLFAIGYVALFYGLMIFGVIQPLTELIALCMRIGSMILIGIVFWDGFKGGRI
jgi:uncharacterized membrane protein